jgi:uncharacterized protein (DUF427 family)
MLVWEPMRIVASYAIPESDIAADLVPGPVAPAPEYRPVGFGDDPSRLLDPSVPFAVHTADGEALTVETGAGSRADAAFRLTDPDLAGYVVLDFAAFHWWEEDEPIVSHPRDPFHRIDVRPSSRRVRLEHQGVVSPTPTTASGSSREHSRCRGTTCPRKTCWSACSRGRPTPPVPTRATPPTTQSSSAYSVIVGAAELANIAWSYEEPLEDATRVRGLVCFYQERLDLILDGAPVERVRTPWS